MWVAAYRRWRPLTQAKDKMYVPTDSFGGMDAEHFVSNILKKLSINATVEVIHLLVRVPNQSSSASRNPLRIQRVEGLAARTVPTSYSSPPYRDQSAAPLESLCYQASIEVTCVR